MTGGTVGPDFFDAGFGVFVRVGFRMVGVILDHFLDDQPLLHLLPVLAVLEAFLKGLVDRHVAVNFRFEGDFGHLKEFLLHQAVGHCLGLIASLLVVFSIA